MIAKTLTGVSFFDEQLGGIYRGRALLACGRSGTGKTILGLQFLLQGLRQEERCLILSGLPAADLTICAEAMDLSIATAIDSGNLVFLEYHDFIPGRNREQNLTLPPEAFDQIREIIDANAVRRVVLDTVLPWVTIPKVEQIAEHVFSFVRAFDRMGTTTLLTLPKPVSSMAFKLKNALEEVVPVSVLLAPQTDRSGGFTWQVSKYLGEKKLGAPVPYSILPGQGLARALEQPVSAPSDAASSAPAPKAAGGPPPVPPPAAAHSPSRVRFASAFPAGGSPPGAPRESTNTSPQSPPEPGPEVVRFSTVWPRPDPKKGPR
ncbi:MAG: ATPase domain-containing protein [Kiritimatiellia bacterium]|nr:ATPase domain-containing protein [Kiritimatiellia bacterium]